MASPPTATTAPKQRKKDNEKNHLKYFANKFKSQTVRRQERARSFAVTIDNESWQLKKVRETLRVG